ncbi:MAG TPA: hypothetical protein VFG21_11965 [Xanthomonadaceae bacterium]|nr:hypothetical protein [Xanthomonadaceae bacterium]
MHAWLRVGEAGLIEAVLTGPAGSDRGERRRGSADLRPEGRGGVDSMKRDRPGTLFVRLAVRDLERSKAFVAEFTWPASGSRRRAGWCCR